MLSDQFDNVRKNLSSDPLWATYAEDLPEDAWTAIDAHAPEVVKKHQKFPLDCGEVCQTWSDHLTSSGIPHEIREGSFLGGFDDDPNVITPGSSRDHVWIDIGGKIFDPTASQFSGKVKEFKPEHYWRG